MKESVKYLIHKSHARPIKLCLLEEGGRGLGNDQSAQVFADLKGIEHNFCSRPHLGLLNKNICGTILCMDKFRARLQLILLSGGKGG
jgi:hypothetical protein